MAGTHTDLRILLLGRAGSGKSATGNTILCGNRFQENVLTLDSTVKKAVVGRRMIKVIDTPGLFYPGRDEEDEMTMIRIGVRRSAPGPHVFLLVIRLDMDLTEEEKNIMAWVQNHFGNQAVFFTFILFTHADVSCESVEDRISRQPDLQLLVNKCQGRYHTINNRDRHNRDQVTELLDKIDQMVLSNRGQYYTTEHFNTAPENDQGILDKLGIVLGIAISVAFILLSRS